MKLHEQFIKVLEVMNSTSQGWVSKFLKKKGEEDLTSGHLVKTMVFIKIYKRSLP
jgi:hypothetical protein